MDKLTKKQQGFVKDYIETDNATEAALNNYDTEDRRVAQTIGSENLSKPMIKKVIESLAEKIPDDLVIEKHIALLNKTEKKYNSDGDLISEEIDTNAVKAGVDMSYKLKGSYAPDKQINLNIDAEITNPKAVELAKKYEEELKKSL